MGREGFEPPKALSQQIYSLPRLTASVPTPNLNYIKIAKNWQTKNPGRGIVLLRTRLWRIKTYKLQLIPHPLQASGRIRTDDLLFTKQLL